MCVKKMSQRLPAIEEKLKLAQLRPTRQRLALAGLLFTDNHRHVTAEQLHSDAIKNGIKISLATIYNNLHQFKNAGILREINVNSGKSYFDTDTSDHHHFYFEDRGHLEDIPAQTLYLDNLPNLPTGSHVSAVDVIVRISKDRT